MIDRQSVYAAIDRFCRLQCPYGPAEFECFECLLLEHRRLSAAEHRRLYGAEDGACVPL